jgi:hypothetical protein
VEVEKGNDNLEVRLWQKAFGFKRYALGIKKLLGVAENPFPELPFFTK